MIDVGMGKENEIQRFRIETGKLAIALIRRPTALEHAAIHDKAQIPGLHQVAGTSHFARGAMKSEFHKARIGFASNLAGKKLCGRDTVQP
jgi:hypothetical protein